MSTPAAQQNNSNDMQVFMNMLKASMVYVPTSISSMAESQNSSADRIRGLVFVYLLGLTRCCLQMI